MMDSPAFSSRIATNLKDGFLWTAVRIPCLLCVQPFLLLSPQLYLSFLPFRQANHFHDLVQVYSSHFLLPETVLLTNKQRLLREGTSMKFVRSVCQQQLCVNTRNKMLQRLTLWLLLITSFLFHAKQPVQNFQTKATTVFRAISFTDWVNNTFISCWLI